MKAQALWLPGEHFLTTNKLLDHLRAEGFYAGVARERGGRHRKEDAKFSTTVKAIRDHAHVQARAAKLQPVPLGVKVSLRFVHMGSGRRDPSSWYLAAKAIEDGLVDAGVLASDRFCVKATGGCAVKADDPDWRREIAAFTGIETEGRAGMFVALLGVDDGA